MSAYTFCLAFMFTIYIALLFNMRRPSRTSLVDRGEVVSSEVRDGRQSTHRFPSVSSRLPASTPPVARVAPTRSSRPSYLA